MYSDAQVQFFASGGLTGLHAKRETFTRSVLDTFMLKPAKLTGNYAGFMDGGVQIGRERMRWTLALGISRYHYTYAPKLLAAQAPEKTSIRYWATSMRVLPAWMCMDDRLLLGLGLEAQYITKPRITHSGVGEHNILEHRMFTLGAVLSASWDFEWLKQDFMIGYLFSYYHSSWEALELQLRYGQNVVNRFRHNFVFNTHSIKLSYVFN